MELPLLYKNKFNVRIVHCVKDESTGRSFSQLEKSERFIKMYKLQGNDSLRCIERYRALMHKYSASFSGHRILRKVKKEIKERRLIKEFSSRSPISLSQLQHYKVSYSPEHPVSIS